MQNLKIKLEIARAVIAAATSEVAKQQTALNIAQREYDRLHSLPPNVLPNNIEFDALSGAAKTAKVKAKSTIGRLTGEIAQAEKEAAHLERLIGAGETLATARESWTAASDAQVQATRAADAAHEYLSNLKTMLTDEQAKAFAASQAQRAAVLNELGFADKQETTAAQAAKALATAEVKIDALTSTAIPQAEARVMRADDALVKCELATQAAERAIVQGHADVAEMNHAVALEAYRAALMEFHGALLAATGLDGQRITLYDEQSRTRFEEVAQRIQAAAEQGE